MNLEKFRQFAYEAHTGQMYGLYPYSVHLAAVELNLFRFSPRELNEDLRAACLGHDLLEDTHVTEGDLAREGCSTLTINIIEAVTDGKTGNRKERKKVSYEKTKEFPEAKLVKMCDRIANIEESIKTGNKHLDMYSKEAEDFIKVIGYGDNYPFNTEINTMMRYHDLILREFN